MMKRKNRKALGIFTTREYGKIEGIIRYCQKMNMSFKSISKYDQGYLESYDPDGIIFQINMDSLDEEKPLIGFLSKTRLPLVTLDPCPPPGVKAISVTHDYVGMGRQMAEDLAERKFKNFLFYGYPVNVGSPGKCETGIYETLKSRNLDISFADINELYRLQTSNPLSPYARKARLKKLLDSFPKPLAVLTPYGFLGDEIITCCREYGIMVPEQVVVVSQIWNEYDSFSEIPLSGIAPDFLSQGYIGAETLDKLICGEKMTEKIIYVPSKPLVVRESSDIIAVENLSLSRALGQISRNFRERGFSVDDMVRPSGVSRTRLFKTFRDKLRTTPEKELMRRRFELAKTFLIETDWKVADVADRSGFSSHVVFSIVFKRRTGLSPMRFRRKFGKAKSAAGTVR